MLGVDVGFVEVETTLDLPTELQIGTLYFVKDAGYIRINHGDKVVDYGRMEVTP